MTVRGAAGFECAGRFVQHICPEVEANRIVIDGDPVFAASGESDIEMLRLRKHRTVRFSDVERRRGGGNFC